MFNQQTTQLANAHSDSTHYSPPTTPQPLNGQASLSPINASSFGSSSPSPQGTPATDRLVSSLQQLSLTKTPDTSVLRQHRIDKHHGPRVGENQDEEEEQLQQQQQNGKSSGTSSPSPQDNDKRTLWQGDLEVWMNEEFIKHLWSQYGQSVNAKVIRDKFTGMNAGYCFVEFKDCQTAQAALNSFNGLPMQGTGKIFKLNWASGGGINDKKEWQGPEYSIFVGDLGPEVDDDLLMSTFERYYPSCRAAKVVTDAVTGLSRGYGFVRFTDPIEQQRAMIEMQGQLCGSRQMRISVATPKNRFNGSLANWALNTTSTAVPVAQSSNGLVSPLGGTAMNYPYWNPQMDPFNTTVFVGGLTNSFVSEEELASYFAPFGPITYVKIPAGKGCGFVSFVHKQSAEQAIANMNGCLISDNRVRLSWGRSSAVGGTPGSGFNSALNSPESVIGGASWKMSGTGNINNGSALISSFPSGVTSPVGGNSSEFLLGHGRFSAFETVSNENDLEGAMWKGAAQNNASTSSYSEHQHSPQLNSSGYTITRPASAFNTTLRPLRSPGPYSTLNGLQKSNSFASAPSSPDVLFRTLHQSRLQSSPIVASAKKTLASDRDDYIQHDQQLQQHTGFNSEEIKNNSEERNNDDDRDDHVAFQVASQVYEHLD